MKFFIFIILALATASCAFKSDDSKPTAVAKEISGSSTINNEVILSANDDSDGDGISDLPEKEMGRNPFLADLPELTVRFLQNYKIEGQYKMLFDIVPEDYESDAPTATATTSTITDPFELPQNGSFVIDTSVGEDDPDFKYRVGSIFVRQNALKNAANVGRYSSHSYGEIPDEDLSRVSYPEVSPKFFHKQALKAKQYFREKDYEITGIDVTLENSVRLEANRGFREIKNLEVNFYNYNYKTETWDLLHTEKIERHFNAGITETFRVKLSNVPRELLSDNYFKKGEFIVSEIKDYEIPELNTTYKTLLASVRQKSIPVAYNTPLENKIYYAAIREGQNTFSNILNQLWGQKFIIEKDDLKKVGQFESNLPDFTYLKEVSTLNKKGKWFTLTNSLPDSYLDHKFRPSDRIVLTYALGDELASQSSEKIYSFRESISSDDDFKIYPLGNVSPNSKIDVQIRPDWRTGQKVVTAQAGINPSGPCGHNCIPSTTLCRWDINTLIHYYERFSFAKTVGGDAEKLELVINDKSFHLAPLLAEGKVRVSFEKDDERTDPLNPSQGLYKIHITIDDISKIEPLSNNSENLVAVKIKATTFNVAEGIVLKTANEMACGQPTVIMAVETHVPISIESLYLDRINWLVNNWLKPELARQIKIIPRREYIQEIGVSVSSSINNYFN